RRQKFIRHHLLLGTGMQILMNNIHRKMMSKSERKILSTMKAQIVMIGMLNEQIQSRSKPGLPSPPSPSIIFFGSLPFKTLNRLFGTENATLGFTFLRNSRSSASGSA